MKSFLEFVQIYATVVMFVMLFRMGYVEGRRCRGCSRVKQMLYDEG